MNSASAALLPVDAMLGGVLAVLLAGAVTVTAWVRLSPEQSYGRPSEVLTAGVRAAVQLAAVSAVMGWVVHRGAARLGFLLLMYAVAVGRAGRRITTDSTWWCAALPITAGVLPTVALLLATALLPLRGISLIPVTGILIGGSLTATVLAGRHTTVTLEQRHGEVEAGLTLGLAKRDAGIEIARPAASDTLVPGPDSHRRPGHRARRVRRHAPGRRRRAHRRSRTALCPRRPDGRAGHRRHRHRHWNSSTAAA
ncbi:putative ABC transport system permease protein [Streptomyces sp. 2131.1]|nr:putative ABC transport system permease protein [Streptomyces sp. 2131.1]